MTLPYSLVIIKSLSIGRGHGPEILSKILSSAPVSLRMMREMKICENSLKALTVPVGPYESNLDFDTEVVNCYRNVPSWVCIFTHIDRTTDPTDILRSLFGPIDKTRWLHMHLRFGYGGMSPHPSDTVFHLSDIERREYESSILFTDFSEESI